MAFQLFQRAPVAEPGRSRGSSGRPSKGGGGSQDPAAALCPNVAGLTFLQPSFLESAPGRACVVSPDFSSLLDGTNILSLTAAVADGGATIFQ